MSEEKRIPDEIFEELCGFVDDNDNPITNITQEEFEIKYSYDTISRRRIQLGGEALFSKVIGKFIKALNKNVFQPFLNDSLSKISFKEDIEEKDNEEKENEEKENFFKKIIDAFKKAYNAVNSSKKFIKRLKKIFKWLVKKVFKGALRKFSKIMRKAGRAVKKLKRGISKLIKFLKKRIRRFAKTLKGLIRKAVRAISSAARAIVKHIKKAFKALRKLLKPIIKRIRLLVKKLKRLLIKIFKPIVKAIRKGIISAGKGIGKAIRKQLLRMGVKSLGKMAAKRAAGAGASLAAGAATSAGIITAPVGAEIAVAGTVINCALFAWDVYDYYTMGKAVVNILGTLDSMDDEIANLESVIASEKAAMAAEEAEEAESATQPPPTIMSLEEALTIYEELHSKMAIRDDIIGYDSQMAQLERIIVSEFERIGTNSAKMKELLETYNNRSLHDLIIAFKSHQNEISAEIMSISAQPSTSSESAVNESSNSNSTKNTFENLNELDNDEEPEGTLIVIWKKIIKYIEENFWASKKSFWKDIENFIPNDTVETILKETIRLPQNSFRTEYYMIPTKHPLEISEFNFEQWAEKGEFETNTEWKIGYKTNDKLKTETIFSIAKQLMGNVYDDFKSYIDSKENEQIANTDKLSILKDIKFALSAV